MTSGSYSNRNDSAKEELESGRNEKDFSCKEEHSESGFERNTLICTEYLNMHFNRSASAPFQRISESFRFLGIDFGLSGQFPERRAAVFNLHMPDHRQIICRRIAEFCKQPLPAGRLGE